MYTLVYSISNEKFPETVYVNLTNACTNACVFCLREQKDDVCGAQMWHDDKYTLEDVIEQFEKFHNPSSNGLEIVSEERSSSQNSSSNLSLHSDQIVKNVVFCGYGEPFLKKDMMKNFAQYLKKNYPEIKIRVNTNGHANAIYKTNVIEEFKGLIDSVSVSLNSDNSEQYNQICKPKIENAYEEVKKFIKSCVEAGISVSTSVVTGFDENIEINIDNCEKISKELGANFRNREFITNGY